MHANQAFGVLDLCDAYDTRFVRFARFLSELQVNFSYKPSVNTRTFRANPSFHPNSELSWISLVGAKGISVASTHHTHPIVRKPGHRPLLYCPRGRHGSIRRFCKTDRNPQGPFVPVLPTRSSPPAPPSPPPYESPAISPLLLYRRKVPQLPQILQGRWKPRGGVRSGSRG